MAGGIAPSTGTLAIVPARYGSSRLPGKPLADIAGVPMIVRVLRGLSDTVDTAVAATDDERVARAVRAAGFQPVMVKKADSGTERVYLAWKILGSPKNVIINVQGDEPMVCREWIKPLVDNPPGDDEVVTLARAVPLSAAGSPHCVKIAVGRGDRALYFSRNPIPFRADPVLEHLGIYAFSPLSLERCVSFGSTALSSRENLEQLAWLENGIHIRVVSGDFKGVGVDTPEDLERAVEYFS